MAEFPSPEVERLNTYLNELLADPARRPAPRQPRTYGGGTGTNLKGYRLPDDVRIEGDQVYVPGTNPNDVWVVTPASWHCTCPAFRKRPPCKHVMALRRLVGTPL